MSAFGTLLSNLYEFFRRSGRAGRSGILRSPPGIEDRHLVDARDGAVRRAGFLCQIFAAQIFTSVILQRRSRIAALLRAVVDESVLANVEIARSGAASPVVGQTLGDVVLKCVDPCKAALFERLHLVIDAALFVA